MSVLAHFHRKMPAVAGQCVNLWHQPLRDASVHTCVPRLNVVYKALRVQCVDLCAHRLNVVSCTNPCACSASTCQCQPHRGVHPHWSDSGAGGQVPPSHAHPHPGGAPPDQQQAQVEAGGQVRARLT
eukprot:1160244-Pelagomonas_calceolata.AAC.10